MAKQRLKSPRARLFVALDLPGEVRRLLGLWQSRSLRDPALRPVRAEALHLTLCFLSYHPERAIPRIGELIRSLGPRPVPMRLEPEPVAIPGGRPRLYAVGAESPAAAELQEELAALLEGEGLYKREKRPFWPHLTVARVRSERLAPRQGERKGRGRPKRVSEPPTRLSAALCEPFGAVRMALYRSNLKPEGAEYVLLEGLDLPSPRAGRRKR